MRVAPWQGIPPAHTAACRCRRTKQLLSVSEARGHAGDPQCTTPVPQPHLSPVRCPGEGADPMRAGAPPAAPPAPLPSKNWCWDLSMGMGPGEAERGLTSLLVPPSRAAGSWPRGQASPSQHPSTSPVLLRWGLAGAQ